MNLGHVEEIANAVLYEGYMLYPYRPSAVKNRQRFNFGVLCPPAYCELQTGSDSWFLQTECLCRTAASARVTIRIRFLQMVQRSIGRYAGRDARELEYVNRLEVGEHVYQSWQESVERAVTYDALDLTGLQTPADLDLSIPSEDSREELSACGEPVGAIIRHAQPLAGSVHIQARGCRDDVVKLSFRLENRSLFRATGTNPSRDEALLHSMVSAHMILGVENGEFLSLLDPPRGCEDLARECQNVGNWPVLADDCATTMLASPIILYDHPVIAPESAGNLFDSTEIDEILALRILTLSDDEKAEIRQSDDRARALLERTENIPAEQFMKLHGVVRGLTEVKEGPA